MKRFFAYAFAICAIFACLVVPLVMAADSTEELDPEKWNSPVKAVLEANKVQLDGVDLVNKNFYILYVVFSKQLTLENEGFFTKLIQDVAKANKFQSYRMEDSENDVTIEVACKGGAVTETTINKKKDFFAALKVIKEKEKQLAAFLVQQVPELKDLEKMMKTKNAKAVMAISVDTEPKADATDPNQRDYYVLNVDAVYENGDSDNLDQFLVHKDLKDVRWYDSETQKYLSLGEWRKMVAAKPYWPDMFK